jgi:hypothetical protein
MRYNSCLAQRKRAGLITRRTLDRNEQQLLDFILFIFLLSFLLLPISFEHGPPVRREQASHRGQYLTLL